MKAKWCKWVWRINKSVRMGLEYFIWEMNSNIHKAVDCCVCKKYRSIHRKFLDHCNRKLEFGPTWLCICFCKFEKDLFSPNFPEINLLGETAARGVIMYLKSIVHCHLQVYCLPASHTILGRKSSSWQSCAVSDRYLVLLAVLSLPTQGKWWIELYFK